MAKQPKKMKLADLPSPQDEENQTKARRMNDDIRAALTRLGDQEEALVNKTGLLYDMLENNVAIGADIVEHSKALKQSLHEHKVALAVIGERMTLMIASLDRNTEALEANTAALKGAEK